MVKFYEPKMEIINFNDKEDVIATSSCSGVYVCPAYDCPECPTPGICYYVKVGG